MEFFELTEKRRSVRAYDATKTVTREQIEKIICAAQQAPSWKNRQPSRFYCLLTGEKHDLFCKECLPARNAAKAVGAALIVTTFVKNVSGFSEDGQTADNECGNGWGLLRMSQRLGILRPRACKREYLPCRKEYGT